MATVRKTNSGLVPTAHRAVGVSLRGDRNTRRKPEAGFTLVEIMVAMLIGTIGLLGTLAVQQSIIAASKNANDTAIATRLASQKVDELATRNIDTAAADTAMGLAPLSAFAGWWPKDAGGASAPEYINAEGVCLCETNGTPKVPSATEGAAYRWRRQWKVANLGVGQPYVISVIVSHSNDVGDMKTTRLDLERRKAW